MTVQNAALPSHCSFTTPRIEFSNSLDRFEQWWPTTAALGEARCYPFQCADVLRVWCDTIGCARNVEPIFVAAFDAANEPIFLLPLGIYSSNGTRVVRFLDGGVSDYNAPVVFPAAEKLAARDTHALWEEIVRHLPSFDIAVLEKMPRTVWDIANPLSSLATGAHSESCHAAELYGPWEEFAKERTPNAADSRRRQRKLEKLGDVRFEIAQCESERRHFLESMISMKRRQYIETKGIDAFETPGFEEYYREATRVLGENGPVQLCALSLDGSVLAAHWGYVTGDRFYYLMPAHEGGMWRALSPGRLLTEWQMRWCVERGLKFFDFGIGDEPYKFGYCDSRIALYDAHLPVTAKGAVYGGLMRAQAAAKSLLRDTKIGGMLKAARSRLRELRPARPAAGRSYTPAVTALICSVTLAVDAA